MKLITLFVLLSILICPISLAATIHGTVYDISLDPIKNIIVEINTNPSQRLVSKTGDYSFEVPKGDYNIIAKKTLNSAPLTEEKINVDVIEGNYVVDLFIFPDFEEKPEKINYWGYIIPPILILGGILLIFKFKKHKKPEQQEEKVDEDINKIINLLKENSGRLTQKELRKHFPLSEAKISLLIAQLEKEGKLEKIKKGRGNILILK